MIENWARNVITHGAELWPAITSARKNILSWDKKQLLGIFILYQNSETIKNSISEIFSLGPPCPLNWMFYWVYWLFYLVYWLVNFFLSPVSILLYDWDLRYHIWGLCTILRQSSTQKLWNCIFGLGIWQNPKIQYCRNLKKSIPSLLRSEALIRSLVLVRRT